MAENHVTVIFDRKKKASENGIGKIELQIRLTRTCRKYITVDECTIQDIIYIRQPVKVFQNEHV